ncbi:MAG TPA: hypothetical protein VHG09_12235, partial [Longimicrobiales bacterium]|nr:hypothetical protein [Longimicrobiales bacterium]
ERMGYQSMAGLTLVSLADLSMLEGDDAGAVAALHRAVRIAADAHNDPLALEALFALARLRLREGDSVGAAELAATIAAHSGSDREVRRRTTELLAEIGIEPPLREAVDLSILIDEIATHADGAAAASAKRVRWRHRISHANPMEDI